MITKEIEEIAKAFPSFVTMTTNLRNPYWIPFGLEANESALETVAKAIWFVVPFHFLTFFGLAATDSGDASQLNTSAGYVVLVGFAVLVVVMWSGSMLAFFGRRKVGFDNRAGAWVSSLTFAWFVCVFILAIGNVMQWAGSGFGNWPPITNLFYKLSQLLGASLDGEQVEVLMAFCAAILALFMTLTVSGMKRRSEFRANPKGMGRLVYGPSIFLVSFFLVLISTRLLQ